MSRWFLVSLLSAACGQTDDPVALGPLHGVWQSSLSRLVLDERNHHYMTSAESGTWSANDEQDEVTLACTSCEPTGAMRSLRFDGVLLLEVEMVGSTTVAAGSEWSLTTSIDDGRGGSCSYTTLTRSMRLVDASMATSASVGCCSGGGCSGQEDRGMWAPTPNGFTLRKDGWLSTTTYVLVRGAIGTNAYTRIGDP